MDRKDTKLSHYTKGLNKNIFKHFYISVDVCREMGGDIELIYEYEKIMAVLLNSAFQPFYYHIKNLQAEIESIQDRENIGQMDLVEAAKNNERINSKLEKIKHKIKRFQSQVIKLHQNRHIDINEIGYTLAGSTVRINLFIGAMKNYLRYKSKGNNGFPTLRWNHAGYAFNVEGDIKVVDMMPQLSKVFTSLSHPHVDENGKACLGGSRNGRMYLYAQKGLLLPYIQQFDSWLAEYNRKDSYWSLDYYYPKTVELQDKEIELTVADQIAMKSVISQRYDDRKVAQLKLKIAQLKEDYPNRNISDNLLYSRGMLIKMQRFLYRYIRKQRMWSNVKLYNFYREYIDKVKDMLSKLVNIDSQLLLKEEVIQIPYWVDYLKWTYYAMSGRLRNWVDDTIDENIPVSDFGINKIRPDINLYTAKKIPLQSIEESIILGNVEPTARWAKSYFSAVLNNTKYVVDSIEEAVDTIEFRMQIRDKAKYIQNIAIVYAQKFNDVEKEEVAEGLVDLTESLNDLCNITEEEKEILFAPCIAALHRYSLRSGVSENSIPDLRRPTVETIREYMEREETSFREAISNNTTSATD